MSAGIFGLSGYNDKNLEGLIPDKTRETYREYGYFGGGINPSAPTSTLSSIERIDYSNDTSRGSIRTFLSSPKRQTASTGNSNFGYFGGGIPGYISTTHRINYSNDSAAVSVRGPLSSAKAYFAATGNSNFGYFGGGYGVATISIIDRIDYSNDLSTASVRGRLSFAKQYLAATGNSNFGYFGGGSPNTSIIERITYSNDTQVLIRTSFSGGIRYDTAGTGNSNFGYFAGGVSPSPGYRSTVDRLNYSNDTSTASPRGPLSLGRIRIGATGNSNFGYFGGGASGIPAASTQTDLVDRIDYSNDTATASVRGPLSSAKYRTSATSSHSFGGTPISQYGVFPKPFGYFGGGDNVIVDRIDYSTDTSTASVRGSLVRTGFYSFAATSNNNFGYFAGQLSSPSPLSKITRINYSNDLSTSLDRGNMSIGRDRFTGAGNVNYGYFAAGNISFPSGTYTTRIDRLDYSNDSNNNLVRGNFTRLESYSTSTANLNFAYFSGGTSQRSTIERLNYSNDTSNNLVRSPLSVASISKGATGNNNFGYIGGGDDITVPAIYSLVQRIDYASDTTTASIRGPLTVNRRLFSATGNSNFGYFGGSHSPDRSSVDRVDYSNDTATASLRGPLSAAKKYHAACSPLTPSSAFSSAQLPLGFSNTDFQPTSTFFDIQSMRRIEDTTNASVRKRVLGSYGYFGGGFPGPFSTVDRIDYSNDTATASVRGPLSSSIQFLSATGNFNFGYFSGGSDVSGPLTSINRIDYSNDTTITNRRANFNFRLMNAGPSGSSNLNFGYFSGGDNSPGVKTVRKLNFSNDLITPSIVGNLSLERYYHSMVGNLNFGYSGGGFNGTLAYSTVDRIDYSNDLSTASVRGPLSSAIHSLSSTGNSNFGYFGGGRVIGTGVISTITRIDYSNDTVITTVRNRLNRFTRDLAATGNSNFGYFSGGGDPGSFSSTDRIDYSNDTQTASVRGPLSSARYRLAATTNARNS